MNVKIESSWNELLSDEFEKTYFQELAGFVREEYTQHQVFPPVVKYLRPLMNVRLIRLK